jgi:SAM-dependent methyltransferase
MATPETNYLVNDNSEVYYSGKYWNDHPKVYAYLNRQVSADPSEWWTTYAVKSLGPISRALILNCGNGHLERGMFRAGLLQEAVGIDYSADLIDEARSEASDYELPLRYERMDVNSCAFPAVEYDAVLNYAAGHHIAFVDRVMRSICDLLPPEGRFISWDYIGPHRNQYAFPIWDAASVVNRGLPPRFQQRMKYPHLPTMLATDPTEAIHSELIMETFRRYFVVDKYVPLGGAIAYLLLTHNENFWAQPDDDERDAVVETVLTADAQYLDSHPEDSLFAYFAGRPNKEVLTRSDDLELWAKQEEDREDAAKATGGEYYSHSTLQHLTLELEDARTERDVARAERALYSDKYRSLVNRFPLRQAVALRQSSAMKAVLSRLVGSGSGVDDGGA